MLDMLFFGFMNFFANIIKFIIVAGVIGFLLIIPFLLKGGWIIGVMYVLWIICTIVALINNKEKENDNNENRD